MTGHSILVVDDDTDFAGLVSEALHDAGYTVYTVHSGQDALRQVYENRPGLVVLDIDLNDEHMDGVMVCKRIREVSEIPIMMLTQQEENEDIIAGLNAGADDYLLKSSFHIGVLLAHVRAVLRRAEGEPEYDKTGVVYSDGFLTFNMDERRVTREGEPVRLSPTEFNLLAALVENAPRVVSYRELLEGVWGFEYSNDIDYLRVYIWHLRRKLEIDPKDPQYIANVPGFGYRFEKQV